MGRFLNLFKNPIFIICLVIGFLMMFLIYLETSNQLTTTFWKFGPVTNDEGKYFKYMTFTMDNWVKVISVYVIIFLTSLVYSIYDNFYKNTFKKHLQSPDYSIISKPITYIFLGLTPFVEMIYYIINFFAVACFQFQYLLPLFIGGFLGKTPYIVHVLSKKI